MRETKALTRLGDDKSFPGPTLFYKQQNPIGQLNSHTSSGGSRGGSGGSLEPHSLPNVFKYLLKMKRFDETNLFHIHEVFKKNEIKSTKRTPTPLYT